MAIFTAIATAALAAVGVTSTFIIGATSSDSLIEFRPDDKKTKPVQTEDEVSSS